MTCTMTHDIIVLGAGMVGVGCALHLQARGQSVALLDRRAPGLETSYGNAGIIQREAIAPYALPRDLGFLLSGATNQRVDVRYHASDAARMLGPLWSYYRHSAPGPYQRISREYETLIALSLDTHAPLMRDAGAEHLVAGQGYLMLYRSERELHEFFEVADERAQAGVHHLKLTGADVAREEPALVGEFAGAVRWTDPWPSAARATWCRPMRACSNNAVARCTWATPWACARAARAAGRWTRPTGARSRRRRWWWRWARGPCN